MEDNRALESFLALLDKAESTFSGDAFQEERELWEYEVKDKDIPVTPSSSFDISSCHDCNACLERMVYAEPILNYRSKLLFIAPFPEGNTIFNDASRAYFNKWIASIGLRRCDISLTMLIKCPVKAFDRNIADICRKHLKEEMTRVEPEAMVLLGSDVASYMLKRSGDFDTVFRGRCFHINSIPSFCTYTPSQLVLSRSLRVPIWEDLKNIAEKTGLGVRK